MTRINSGIHVQQLTDEHLLAEHREIKRIPQNYLAAIRTGSINRIPQEFKLGTGHVLFFVNKPEYTLNRYQALHAECLNRGFNVSDYSHNWDVYEGSEYPMQQYSPTTKDCELIIARIIDRILHSKKKSFRYYGENISANEAVELLTK